MCQTSYHMITVGITLGMKLKLVKMIQASVFMSHYVAREEWPGSTVYHTLTFHMMGKSV